MFGLLVRPPGARPWEPLATERNARSTGSMDARFKLFQPRSAARQQKLRRRCSGRCVAGLLLLFGSFAAASSAPVVASPRFFAMFGAVAEPLPAPSKPPPVYYRTVYSPPVYLARVGPPPLRFTPSRAAEVAVVVLPPLDMGSSSPDALPPQAEVQAAPVAAAAPATSTEPGVALTSSSPAAQAPALSFSTLTTEAGGEPVFTPQTLMRYFMPRAGTNATETAVLVPLHFVPPQPARTSSSATYSKSPP
jgi:hypothetical protein